MIKLQKLCVCVALAASLLSSSCEKKSTEPKMAGAPEKTATIVAEVNGEPILQADLDARLVQRQQQAAALHENAPDRKAVLDDMINSVLLIQYAKTAKIDQDPEVQGTLKRAEADVLLQAVRHKLLWDRPITNEEIQTRMQTAASPSSRKLGKNEQLAAEQQLRAQAYRALQDERVNETLKDLRSRASIVVK